MDKIYISIHYGLYKYNVFRSTILWIYSLIQRCMHASLIQSLYTFLPIYSGRLINQYCSEQRRLEINHIHNRNLWPLHILKVITSIVRWQELYEYIFKKGIRVKGKQLMYIDISECRRNLYLYWYLRRPC